MICASSHSIGLYQTWNVGRFSSVMVSHDYLGTVFPFPTDSTGTRRRVHIFGVKQGARPKQRIKPTDFV